MGITNRIGDAQNLPILRTNLFESFAVGALSQRVTFVNVNS
jgi:hypothetical protein